MSHRKNVQTMTLKEFRRYRTMSIPLLCHFCQGPIYIGQEYLSVGRHPNSRSEMSLYCYKHMELDSKPR